ncbi:MAG: hypothetical protein RMK45_05845 [Armatimonadota bacterium]|nr:hypothetical protein [Armatimonadota bacterium]
MAVPAIVHQRWREHLRAWWDEYYVDNPIVWMLQRGLVRLPRRTSDERGLPLWSRGRTAWACFWWSVAIFGVIATSVNPSLQMQLRQLPGATCASSAFFAAIWGFAAPASVGTVGGIFARMREQRQLAMIGMTRLTGRHIVYAGLLGSWLHGTLMRTLIAYLPLLWWFHTVQCGSAFAALLVAAGSALLWNGTVLLLTVISVFLTPLGATVRESGAGNRTSVYDMLVPTQLVAMVLLSVSFVCIVLMSQAPVLALTVPVVWLLALMLMRPAIRRAERILRSKEPTIAPPEGRWQ